MRRIALVLVLTAAATAVVFGGRASTGSAATQACAYIRPSLGVRTCHGTAALKIGTNVKHFTSVVCIIAKTSDAPIYVFAKQGFVLSLSFARHSRQSSFGGILTYAPNKKEIDISVKARLQANRHNGSFVGVPKSSKLSGSFTCKRADGGEPPGQWLRAVEGDIITFGLAACSR